MQPARRTVGETETRRANRRDWDGYADEYQATHGAFLRDVGFVWCPEGVDETDVHILGEVAGYGLTCDAHHITAPVESGAGAAAAMEMALTSVVPPGKAILTIENGAFGERLGEIVGDPVAQGQRRPVKN